MSKIEALLAVWIVLFIFLGLQALNAAACRARAERMNMLWSYDILTDCMIQVGEQWIPLTSFNLTTEN